MAEIKWDEEDVLKAFQRVWMPPAVGSGNVLEQIKAKAQQLRGRQPAGQIKPQLPGR